MRTAQIVWLAWVIVAGCQPVESTAARDGAVAEDAASDAERAGLDADATDARATPAADAAQADASWRPPLDADVRDGAAPAGDAAPGPDALAPDAAAVAACAAGDVESRPCGLNGRGEQVRACAGGAWGDWVRCIDPDACVDDTLDARPCENGVEQRQCTAGQWGAWRCDLDRCLGWPSYDVFWGDAIAGTDTATNTFSQHRGSCGGAAPEGTFDLILDAPAEVCLRAVGFGIDPILYVRRDCHDPDSEIACDDDGGGLTDALLKLNLDAGTYKVFIDSDAGAGRAVLYLQRPTPEGDCPDPPTE